MPTKNMGKVLAIPANLCYNTRMSHPLKMDVFDMIHEAVLSAHASESSAYGMNRWIIRSGIANRENLCARIGAAIDILAAVRKDIESIRAKEYTHEATPLQS